MIATIPVVIPTTLAAVLFGLLFFYAVAAVTKADLVIPAVATTMVVIVFGLFFYFYVAVVTVILSVNLLFIQPTYSESAAEANRRSMHFHPYVLIIYFSYNCTVIDLYFSS